MQKDPLILAKRRMRRKRRKINHTMKEVEEVKLESGVPMPGTNRHDAAPPDHPCPVATAAKDELEKEIELLRMKLENAELRAKLSEAKASFATEPAKAINLARPMPSPQEIPPGLPPMPKVDPAAGDKTPDVVRWFKKYWPEEYAIRYKGRKTVLDDLRRGNPGETVAMSPEERREASAPDFSPCKGEEGLDLTPRTFTV